VKLTPRAVVFLLLVSSCARKTGGAYPQGSDAGLQRPDPGIASALESVKTPTAPMKTPREECEDLMNAVLPFAKQMLSQHREFFPFGGTMSPSGEITHTPDGLVPSIHLRARSSQSSTVGFAQALSPVRKSADREQRDRGIVNAQIGAS
jgi:hypothetical protein